MKHFILTILFSILLIYCKNKNQKIDTPKIDTFVSKKNIELDNKKQIKDIDSLLNKNIKNASLWAKKAILYLINKNRDSAIICYKKAINIDNKNNDYKISLAYIYAEDNNIKALELCDEILKNKKTLLTPKVYYIKGVYYTSNLDYKNAIINFENCIKTDWTFIDAYLEKGILLLKTNKIIDAIKNFKLAIKINNKNAESYYWLGRSYEAKNEITNSINLYKKALLLDPKFEEAKQRLKLVINKK